MAKELTKKQKKRLDRMLNNLLKYFQTPEGEEMSSRMDHFLAMKVVKDLPAPPTLSENETKALKFIRSERKKGHSPSVREVARIIGLKSSRSGMKIVNALYMKGVLEKRPAKSGSLAESLK